jgi:hypothetical protein
MENQLVTLGTFPNLESARFIRNLLDAEGIRSYLADETTGGMLWHLGNAIGWIKLQVAETDLPRAQEILEAQRQTLDDLGPEAFAAEAVAGETDDEVSANVTDTEVGDRPRTGAESDDEVVNPTDDMALRAFRASAIGIVFCPILLYAVWLIARLIFSKAELSPRASRHLWLAFGITAAGLCGYWLFLRGPF